MTQRTTEYGTKSTRLENEVMTENELAFKVIGAAIEVHKKLGPGLLSRHVRNVGALN
ncbi:MAG: hypothetical protein U5K51_03185 [Flavobacteriaceae bacterium]|nr:hypothetical protein [Flavobacteriaceae bacterium]